jgi:sulfur-carrier protein adenylyltransferase/sulfurtransferase
MTVEELKRLQDDGPSPLVLDVREPFELALAPFPFPVVAIPLGALPGRFRELPTDAAVVCACRSGGRSARAVEFLRAHGVAGAVNLEGGILAWSSRIDPRVPRY